MLTSFSGLLHTGRGLTCSGSTWINLSNAKECSDAVQYAKSFNGNARYSYEIYESGKPKGCFIYDSGTMYFNVHPTGRGAQGTRNICKPGNTSNCAYTCLRNIV